MDVGAGLTGSTGTVTNPSSSDAVWHSDMNDRLGGAPAIAGGQDTMAGRAAYPTPAATASAADLPPAQPAGACLVSVVCCQACQVLRGYLLKGPDVDLVRKRLPPPLDAHYLWVDFLREII